MAIKDIRNMSGIRNIINTVQESEAIPALFGFLTIGMVATGHLVTANAVQAIGAGTALLQGLNQDREAFGKFKKGVNNDKMKLIEKHPSEEKQINNVVECFLEYFELKMKNEGDKDTNARLLARENELVKIIKPILSDTQQYADENIT